MHYVILALILVVTTSSFLIDMRLLPSLLKLLPEMLSIVIALFVVIAGMVQRFQFVRPAYWMVFGALLVAMLCGVLINSVEPGPLVAGMRAYLRAIPLFLLPAVYLFKDWQIRQQLQLLLALALVQLPIAVYQRLTLLQAHRWSGDGVFGTLMISSVMSMFLICAACVVTGLFLRKRLSKKQFILLFFLLLVPTALNETKGTLLLLPVALVTTLMIGSPREKRLRISIAAAALLVTFFTIYVTAYDYLSRQNNPYPYSLTEFFMEKGRVERYLTKDTGVGTRSEVGRVDTITVPLSYFSNDPVKLTFGLGIGNVSHSSLGPYYVGQYFSTLGPYATTTSAGAFLLETGLLGISLIVALYWLIFSDARAVARVDCGLTGAIAIGWAGATVLLAAATFYKSTHTFESLSYLFWYFSGLIAARRANTLRCGTA